MLFKNLSYLLAFLFILATDTFAQPKNIIIVIGDGMGISTISAARKLNQEQHQQERLSFERFPATALVDVKCHDYLVPDSACTATAIATGLSANSGVIGLGADVRRGSFANYKQSESKSLLSLAAEKDLLTGLITTTSITDATPAAFFGHSPERGWQSDMEIPGALRGTSFKDLATQLVEYEVGGGIDLIFGGGRQRFLGTNQVDSEYQHLRGQRLDGQDLTVAWTQKNPGAKYVWNKQDLLATVPEKAEKVMGLFEPGNLAYEYDRNKESKPSLSEMVSWGLDFFASKEAPGFFLMIEGGKIDHAHHENLARVALEETIELSKAIEVVLGKVNLEETLIIVTADHSHALGIVGYPKNSESILGQTSDPDAYPSQYSFLNYLSGPGAGYAGNKQSQSSHDYGYRQNSLIQVSGAKHSGEDVALYAIGAGSENFHGAIAQRQIFEIIKSSANF